MTPEKPHDPVLQKIQLSRGEASYTDVGEGPPLIAIHGLPGSVRDYRWLGASIPPHIRLIRVNMPGFGETQKSCGPGVTIAHRASFVVELLDALNIEKCVVLGHSMGGPVATEIAARYPHRVLGLALLASVGLRPHHMLRRSPSPRWLSRFFRIPGTTWLLKRKLRQAYQRIGFPDSIPDSALVHTIHIIGTIRFTQIRETQKLLTAPTFLSWAEDDRFIEKEVFQEHEKLCPKGPRLVFPKGGHNIQKTHAIELGEALTSWLHELFDFHQDPT